MVAVTSLEQQVGNVVLTVHQIEVMRFLSAAGGDGAFQRDVFGGGSLMGESENTVQETQVRVSGNDFCQSTFEELSPESSIVTDLLFR
jgi:hypothetical protein